MIGRCAKQVVTAYLVTKDGDTFVGTNFCHNAQKVCPRKDLPTGHGYVLCHTICKQAGHAEDVAISIAGKKAKGSVIYLEGHTYACDYCKMVAKEAGVKDIIILDKWSRLDD